MLLIGAVRSGSVELNYTCVQAAIVTVLWKKQQLASTHPTEKYKLDYINGF